MGLKGDSLALASGMLPVEYRQLCQFDPLAELAAQKGRADNELRAAQMLNAASDAGDAKASLAILTHAHGWQQTSTVNVNVEQRISVISALEQAKTRVLEGSATIDEAPERINGRGLLTNNDEDTSHGYQHSNASAA
tara:strand:+ start:92 stop:502 length:411 start_codon:yes stop_codon:yes gene_type:complete